MVDQEDIIALTKHVRGFSDALNNLRNSFKDSLVDGVYNQDECQPRTHTRLSNVLKILQGILAKYPPLHSPDILAAAANIIHKIKTYNYADGEEGPPDFYGAIDQLALSFSSSVSDFLMGDKDIRGSPNAQHDQDDENDGDGEEYEVDDFGDTNFLNPEDDESEKNDESEDSLERLTSYRQDSGVDSSYRQDTGVDNICTSTPESDIVTAPSLLTHDISDPIAREGANTSRKHGIAYVSSFSTSKPSEEYVFKDELDKTLLSIEESVEIALKRTKIWSKYAKDLLMYIERRSNYELEFCRQIDKLAKQTRTSITEESFLPLQSIFVTALEHDIEFNSNFHKSYHSSFVPIVEKLTQQQKEHDIKRSKIKTRWKAGLKKQHDSVEALKNTKKLYIQKEKEMEKFNKQQLEGKDEKGGFTIGKKKVQEDFEKNVTESEENYKKCVEDANNIQAELDRTKAEVLLQFRQLIFECDLVMKSACVAYFEMMNVLISPLPIQYTTLHDESKLYKEGQQISDYVQLQRATCNQSHSPTYYFEPYKSDNKYSFYHKGGEQPELVSPTHTKPRTQSNNSDSYEFQKSPNTSANKKGAGSWGSLGRTKGSATDDTDSLSSHSLPGSPQNTPPKTRRSFKVNASDIYSDEEHGILKEQLKVSEYHLKDQLKVSVPMGLLSREAKNRKLSAAAEGHKFRRLHAPSKCKECDSYVYFNGQECEQCGIICHKKCLETLAIKCGNKRLPRKMTTFGVDFMQHLASTQRTDIPYIIEKCVNTIDEIGLGVKGIYRVSGVKSKVEKLCQCFEAGGDLVDLSNTPPHFISSVLKLYLRQLPEPLLTFKLYHPLINVGKESMHLKLGPDNIDHMSPEDSLQYEDIIRRVHEIIQDLPEPNFFTAAKIIRHLRRVADNQEENQMNAGNLAIVFGPTLLRPEGANSLAAVMDMPHQSRAVELLILNSHIFSHTKDGEIDIETLTGEKRRAPSRRRHPKRGRIDTVPEASDELHEDREATVSSEFTSEMLTSFSMEENIVPFVDVPCVASTPEIAAITSGVTAEETNLGTDVFASSSQPVTVVQSIPIVQSVTVGKATPIGETPPLLQTTTVQPTKVVVHSKSIEQTGPHVQATTAVRHAPHVQTTTTVQPVVVHTSPVAEPTPSEQTIQSVSPVQSKPISIPQNDYVSVHVTDVEAKRHGIAFSRDSDYDNLPGLESDILNHDLPDDNTQHRPLACSLSACSNSSTTDTDSVYSRFTSIESLLMGDIGTSSSTTNLPMATLDQEDSDDAWMNRFGKDTVTKLPVTKTVSSSALETRSSAVSTSDIKPDRSSMTIDPFSYPTRKKKDASFSRIETTSYSFSLGNTLKDDEKESVESANDSELSGWVKREGKERVPVRKYLKSVNIKATNVPSPPLPLQPPTSPPLGLKETPFTLLEPKVKSENTTYNKSFSGSDHGSSLSIDSDRDDLFAVESLHDDIPVVGAEDELSLSKRAPAVLPKPKKHLDKKSWTADLIKSKSQTMADHPQPGSLNDKLLSINRRKTEEKPCEPGISRTATSSRSIKEIRTNFAVSSRSNTSELDKECNLEISKLSDCSDEHAEKGERCDQGEK